MNTTLDYSNSPTPEYRFFVHDPQGNGFMYFTSAEARDQASVDIIRAYLDDGWDEEVEYVVAGEITHTCEKINEQHRPDVIDAEGNDAEGQHWGEFETMCDYGLIALPAAPESGVTIVMAEGYEHHAHQGIPGTSFQALNAKANAGDL